MGDVKIIYRGFICMVLIVSLPLMLFISIGIVLTSGFPILFRQKRIGKDGKPFILYKFRTMQIGAENQQHRYAHLNQANGPVFKIHDDPRFTNVGKFLSHTGLDELPQLVNVFDGQMALVGPRPLPVTEAKKLTPAQQKRHLVKPGLISPWIVEGYHRQSFAAWMQSDVVYAQTKSLTGDMRLFTRAIRLLVRLFIQELGI
jgi:lipopolysaccharide/colanic/teichoic acid biosynthesis glycosyltransferase